MWYFKTFSCSMATASLVFRHPGWNCGHHPYSTLTRHLVACNAERLFTSCRIYSFAPIHVVVCELIKYGTGSELICKLIDSSLYARCSIPICWCGSWFTHIPVWQLIITHTWYFAQIWYRNWSTTVLISSTNWSTTNFHLITIRLDSISNTELFYS